MLSGKFLRNVHSACSQLPWERALKERTLCSQKDFMDPKTPGSSDCESKSPRPCFMAKERKQFHCLKKCKADDKEGGKNR